MTHVPHELHEEFPDDDAVIHRLKVEDAHFARIADKYHEVNRSIHRIETKVEPASEQRFEELRKHRLLLKDDIAGMIRAAGNATDEATG